MTGDAVNTAARLEQAATPGEVLIGEPTFRLVRDAVEVEAVEPLAAKGKAEPVNAYRLRAVRSLAPGRARRLGGCLVGRTEELAGLRRELDAAAGGACRLVSVIGEAGVGKSRLVRALVAEAEALVLEGALSRPTGRASPTGRWPRSSAPPPGSTTRRRLTTGAHASSRWPRSRRLRPSAGGSRAGGRNGLAGDDRVGHAAGFSSGSRRAGSSWS